MPSTVCVCGRKTETTRLHSTTRIGSKRLHRRDEERALRPDEIVADFEVRAVDEGIPCGFAVFVRLAVFHVLGVEADRQAEQQVARLVEAGAAVEGRARRVEFRLVDQIGVYRLVEGFVAVERVAGVELLKRLVEALPVVHACGPACRNCRSGSEGCRGGRIGRLSR